MEIKEVETLLSVSRSNIRFYEKAGLIHPERKENNYRDYSEQDIAALKKILVLRKLGFRVEEISAMQKGELSLADAIPENILRLEKDIEELKAALEMTKMLSGENPTIETLDQDRLWNEITEGERRGQQYTDICKDYLLFELEVFDTMWQTVFFHNFKKDREKYGVPIACGILLLLCVVRGIGHVTLRHESFWDGFLYPIILFAVISAIVLPLYILSKKAPKAASVIATGLVILAAGILILCALLIIFGLIRSVFT